MSILTEASDDISIATSYCTVGTRKSKRNRGKKIEYNKEQIFEQMNRGVRGDDEDK